MEVDDEERSIIYIGFVYDIGNEFSIYNNGVISRFYNGVKYFHSSLMKLDENDNVVEISDKTDKFTEEPVEGGVIMTTIGYTKIFRSLSISRPL